MTKPILMGILFGVGGGLAGLLVFILLVRLNWLDGPGGGMFVFPLALIPAIGLGAYGFASSLIRMRRSNEVQNSD